jgi:uncharacterized protein (DUF488 family)
VEIYTIGFGGHSASEFFGALRSAAIRQLIDVRLNNVSQLAGFTKRDDLRFFLSEILGATYRHEPDLAPTQELLGAYRSKKISWAEYERSFLELMAERRIEDKFGLADVTSPTVLLCSEPTAERCHRRLVAEYLARTTLPGLVPVHMG